MFLKLFSRTAQVEGLLRFLRHEHNFFFICLMQVLKYSSLLIDIVLIFVLLDLAGCFITMESRRLWRSGSCQSPYRAGVDSGYRSLQLVSEQLMTTVFSKNSLFLLSRVTEHEEEAFNSYNLVTDVVFFKFHWLCMISAEHRCCENVVESQFHFFSVSQDTLWAKTDRGPLLPLNMLGVEGPPRAWLPQTLDLNPSGYGFKPKGLVLIPN